MRLKNILTVTLLAAHAACVSAPQSNASTADPYWTAPTDGATPQNHRTGRAALPAAYEPVPTALADCGLKPAEAGELQSLNQMTGQSVHEMIACGGAQVRLANTLLVSLFLGSKDATDMTPETFAILENYAGYLNIDLKTAQTKPVGQWWQLMQANAGGQGMTFAAQFASPDGKALRVNPFKLSAYLEEPKVTSTLTLGEMFSSLGKKNTYTFAYKRPGPLGYLLTDGENHLPNPIVVEANMQQFLELLMGETQPGAFAPLNRLTDVQMTSKGSLKQGVDDATMVACMAHSWGAYVAASVAIDHERAHAGTAHGTIGGNLADAVVSGGVDRVLLSTLRSTSWHAVQLAVAAAGRILSAAELAGAYRPDSTQGL